MQRGNSTTDAHYLSLENLLYERDHLRAEIERTRDFDMPEFSSITLPALPVSAAADGGGGPPRTAHEAVLEQLALEATLRREMEGDLAALTARLNASRDANAAKRAFLEGLPAKIAALGSAMAPFEQGLGLYPDSAKARYSRGLALPGPLYVLFSQLAGLVEADASARSIAAPSWGPDGGAVLGVEVVPAVPDAPAADDPALAGLIPAGVPVASALARQFASLLGIKPLVRAAAAARPGADVEFDGVMLKRGRGVDGPSTPPSTKSTELFAAVDVFKPYPRAIVAVFAARAPPLLSTAASSLFPGGTVYSASAFSEAPTPSTPGVIAAVRFQFLPLLGVVTAAPDTSLSLAELRAVLEGADVAAAGAAARARRAAATAAAASSSSSSIPLTAGAATALAAASKPSAIPPPTSAAAAAALKPTIAGAPTVVPSSAVPLNGAAASLPKSSAASAAAATAGSATDWMAPFSAITLPRTALVVVQPSLADTGAAVFCRCLDAASSAAASPPAALVGAHAHYPSAGASPEATAADTEMEDANTRAASADLPVPLPVSISSSSSGSPWPLSVSGRPFYWAQWLAGIAVPPPRYRATFDATAGTASGFSLTSIASLSQSGGGSSSSSSTAAATSAGGASAARPLLPHAPLPLFTPSVSRVADQIRGRLGVLVTVSRASAALTMLARNGGAGGMLLTPQGLTKAYAAGVLPRLQALAAAAAAGGGGGFTLMRASGSQSPQQQHLQLSETQAAACKGAAALLNLTVDAVDAPAATAAAAASSVSLVSWDHAPPSGGGPLGVWDPSVYFSHLQQQQQQQETGGGGTDAASDALGVPYCRFFRAVLAVQLQQQQQQQQPPRTVSTPGALTASPSPLLFVQVLLCLPVDYPVGPSSVSVSLLGASLGGKMSPPPAVIPPTATALAEASAAALRAVSSVSGALAASLSPSALACIAGAATVACFLLSPSASVLPLMFTAQLAAVQAALAQAVSSRGLPAPLAEHPHSSSSLLCGVIPPFHHSERARSGGIGGGHSYFDLGGEGVGWAGAGSQLLQTAECVGAAAPPARGPFVWV